MNQKRIEWVDYAKGLSIILVVAHHSIARDSSSVFYNAILLELNDTLKLLRMPLFFFLSGLFVHKALKMDFISFFKSRILNLLYIFVLWSVLRYLIIIIAPYIILGNDRTPEHFLSIFYIFIDPPSVWFIYALLIFILITRLTRNHLKITLGVSLVLYILSIMKGNHHDPAFIDELSRYYPMYLLGYFMSDIIKSIATKLKWYHSLLTLTIPYLFIVYTVMNSEYSSTPVLIFILMVLGILSGVAISVSLTKVKGLSWLQYVGQNTLPIYVLHAYPMKIITFGLAAIIPGLTFLAVPILIVFGVFIPIITNKYAKTFKLGWLFQNPFLKQNTKKTSLKEVAS